MSISNQDYLAHLQRVVQLSGIQVGEIVLPTDHHVVLNGHRFHYLDWGGGDTPPVVFLHGSGLTAHTWDVICLALRDRFHCFAVDLRGHGESEWSPIADYAFESYVDDCESFIVHVAAERPPVLVGHSLGGMTAIRVAARRRVALAALVVVDIAPRTPPEDGGPEPARPGVDAIAQFMALPPVLDSVDAFIERAMEFNPRRDRETLRTSLLHNLRELPNGKWTWRYDRRHREPDPYRPDAPRVRATWADVEAITVPTLVVRGEHSRILDQQRAEYFADTLATGRLAVVKDAGHTVQGDKPAHLLTALSEFGAEFHLGAAPH